jgi:hypothetical protein
LVDLNLLQSVSYIAGALGVCVAATYYVMTLRITQNNLKANLETRQAQLLMNIYERWAVPNFQDAWLSITKWQWRDYDEFTAKYMNDKESSRIMNLVGSLLEGLGVYVKRGFIDATLVDDLMSSYVVVFWQKLGPIFIEYRKRMNSPTSLEYGEYLYNVIYEIWMREHPESPRPLQTT